MSRLLLKTFQNLPIALKIKTKNLHVAYKAVLPLASAWISKLFAYHLPSLLILQPH